MQINLLSLFSPTSENPAVVEGAQASSLLDGDSSQTVEGLLAEGEVSSEQFNQLFEGKLAEIMPEGSENLPAPKLMAAFLQRLHLIVPEAEGLPEGVNPELPELSAEQVAAMAQVLGVDPKALTLNAGAAESAQQIFPQGEGLQHVSVSALVSVLRELVELGQEMYRQGLTLVEVSASAEASNFADDPEARQQVMSLLSLLNFTDKAPEELEVEEFSFSEASIASLARLFEMPEAEIKQNIKTLKLIPVRELQSLLAHKLQAGELGFNNLDERTKAPGLLQLLAQVLNQPAQEVWDKLEELTDGEADLPLSIVLAAVVNEADSEVPREFLEFGFGLPRKEIAQEGLTIGKGDYVYPAPIGPNVPASGNSLQLAAEGKASDAAKLWQPLAASITGQPAEVGGNSSRKVIRPGAVSSAAVGNAGAAISPLAGAKQEVSATSRVANASLPLQEEETALSAPLPRAPEKVVLPERSTREQGSSFSAITREASPRAAAALKANTVQPLLREGVNRPVVDKAPVETSSTLALTASESKLDFDSRLRESRSFAARDNATTNSVREQVAVQVKKGVANGDTRISIRLHPAELGRVDVRVEVSADGRTTLAIVADNRDTLEMLQRDSRSLEKAFSDLGMEMSDSGMSFDLREQFSGQQQENQGGESANKEPRNSFEALLNNPDEIVAEALLDSPDMSYMVGVDDGLNIKV